MRQSVLREPVIHFLVLGSLIFAVFHWLSDESDASDQRTIIVDEAAILEFMQYRSKFFDSEAVRRRFFGFSEQRRKLIVKQFVREEALYRRALDYGFDQGDYVIRLRLVQKMDFTAEGLAIDHAEIADDAVRAHYQANLVEYTESATTSFVHVFHSLSKNGVSLATSKSSALLDRLNAQGVTLEQASQYGDRFPYHVNYVEKTLEQVTDHFGMAMARQLFSLPVNRQQWQGGFQSEHGSHLVLMADSNPARVPEFAEVAGQVLVDLRNQIKSRHHKEYIDEVLGHYRVEIDPGLLSN